MATWTRNIAMPDRTALRTASGSAAKWSPFVVALALSALSALGVLIIYAPFLAVPLISDDYLQIDLARRLNLPGGYADLAADVLYRSRATSLVLTNLTDNAFGPDAAWHRALNFLFHAINVLLVAWLGAWSRIGYRLSIPAAAVFLAAQNHQEAIVWTAALPELLVATCVLAALNAWIQALNRRSVLWMGVATLCYLVSLASKESGVVFLALAAGILLFDRVRWSVPVAVLGLQGIVTAAYALGIFRTTTYHLHLNDGTFTVQPGFIVVTVMSIGRLLFPVGWAAAAVVAASRNWRFLAGCLAATISVLSPYVFLTYMNRVPSRHTYMATAPLAMLLAFAGLLLWDRFQTRKHRAMLAAAAACFFLFNAAYLWTKKLDQYQRRAASSEAFLRLAKSGSGPRPIRIDCAPLPSSVYRQASDLILHWPQTWVGTADELRHFGRNADQAERFCDPIHP